MRKYYTKTACIITISFLIIIICSSITFAFDDSNREEQTFGFNIPNEGLLQYFTVYYTGSLFESYTLSSNQVAFTEHATTSYYTDWTGWLFGSIENWSATSVDFYQLNSNNTQTYVKSAALWADNISGWMWDPDAEGKEAYYSNWTATVNTRNAIAKTTFVIYCPDATYSNASLPVNLTIYRP